jgi:FKBP-type peptidyl-prolyl cis-trans isomerase
MNKEEKEHIMIKKIAYTAIAAAMTVALVGCQDFTKTEKTEANAEVKTEAKAADVSKYTFDQKVAMSIGYITGKNVATPLKEINDLGVVLDKNIVAEYLVKGFNDEKFELSDEEFQAVMQEFSKQLEVKQKAKMEAEMAKKKIEAEKNLEIGKKFLEENKTKEGVQVTESGLQYKVIELGKGTEKATATSTVKAKYKGTTIDGKVFDESKDAVAFPLNGVIAGWTEGLQLFPAGSKFELYIPANLAYGEHSPSPAIPANSVLIFEIELVEIVKPEGAK